MNAQTTPTNLVFGAMAAAFNTTQVFAANQISKAKIVINQGGTSSSKTYSIMQLLFCRATERKRIITVTGESLPNLRKGAYRDAETIYAQSPDLQNRITMWNKADRVIYFKNGSVIEFTSNSSEQTAKAGKRDILFVNEANGISWTIFWQLAIRTREQIFIDYNPSAPFWAHEKLIGTAADGNDLSATVDLIISDHRHNCFLTPDEHRKIEGIKDKELWAVYARGRTGNLQGLIFPDWRIIPDKDFPWSAPKFAGQDFGYTNDPTAGVRIARIDKNIYLHELCYETALTPTQLKVIYSSEKFTEDDPIYCEHDGDMIRQMKILEMMAIAARKGPGSIKAGILKLKEYNVFYTESSDNIHKERAKYMWMIDPETGKPTNTPIDAFNHLIDATRYGVYTHFYREA